MSRQNNIVTLICHLKPLFQRVRTGKVLFVVALAAALSFVACGEDDEPRTFTSSMSIVRSDLLFESAGRTGSVQVAGVAPFAVSSSSSWAEARVEGDVIYVTVAGNDGLDGRTAVLTVTDARGDKLEIPVQQRGMVIGRLSEESHYVKNAGTTIEYTLTHDRPVTFSTNVDWLHPSIEGNTVRIVVDENVEGFIRRGTVSYESQGYGSTLTIAQYDLENDVIGTYSLGGFSGDAVIATRIELMMRHDSLFMRFIRNDRWAENPVPLGFDRGNCRVIFRSAENLYYANASNYDAFYLTDNSANRVATTPVATMVADLVHSNSDGEDITFAVLADGGTWPGYKCDGIYIRSMRSGFSTTMMSVRTPFLMRLGPLGMVD